ncbi:hypothetical protein E8E13_003283 [Curvularia kusanoi]|uniref:Copper homeostasis protein cutC homolog n=1 Tax=Curvularia kusanoi TaxID=90978 RepID=A0A9P4TN19_CURKU|nr:hypothetical protein E8E13_003283 [Curvularia kusanoi]
MLEIACFNAASAIAAALAGADRIELCADYSAGGVTPSLSTLHAVRSKTDKPINVMIRPRGGDFNYSAAELSQVKSSIETFKASGMVNGFVFGVLDAADRVDVEKNRELIGLAAPLPCTFHRAIDGVEDICAAVEMIIDLGFRNILTSGGASNATSGADEVAGLQKKYGQRISLILGGGIRSANVQELKRRTGVEWMHSAAITSGDETVDEEEVKKMIALLQDA